MSPEDHYRRMMFSLSEQGSYEEQQQRLYQLASSMDLLRARQEALVAAVRSPALEAHLPSGSSSSSSQRRKQGLPQHRDRSAFLYSLQQLHLCYSININDPLKYLLKHRHEHTTFCFRRDLSQPPPLLSPPTAPHITLGPHLRPPFLGMPTALCQAPGFGFLPPAQAEIFARQQEMLRKQNLARLEMSAELLRQKELENLRQQPLPADHPALRNIQDLPEGHPLREELARRASAMLVLRHGATPPLLSLNQPQSGTSTPKDPHGHSSATGSDSRKCPSGGSGGPPGPRHHQEEDSDSEADTCEDKPEGAEAKSRSKLQDRERGEGKEATKGLCVRAKESTESSGRNSAPCNSSEIDSPSRLFSAGQAKDVKYHLPPGFMPPLPALLPTPTPTFTRVSPALRPPKHKHCSDM
uniref:Uncharacterized protein n=1 Tax=Periophthalmus magnuspinnatus TaxID=409849 RepID=A0A3B4A489_9GOBI